MVCGDCRPIHRKRRDEFRASDKCRSLVILFPLFFWGRIGYGVTVDLGTGYVVSLVSVHGTACRILVSYGS